MSRWAEAFAAFDDGADKTDTSDKILVANGIERICVTCVHSVTPSEAMTDGFVAGEPSAPTGYSEASPESAWAEDLEERAALIEYGAAVPRQWAEGYAALCTMTPPDGFSPERWRRIVDGAGRFMDRWAAKAAQCGWSNLDVFGADSDRPDRRFDCMGLVLSLDRCEIVSIDEHGADLLVAPGGAQQRYRRRPFPVHTRPLWVLAS